MSETLLFYLFSSMAIVTSLLVIGQRNPVYSIMLLILSFGALAGLYVQLDAPFAAVIQIIVYAGAILVLFLFVVMLLNAPREDAADWDRTHPLYRPGPGRLGAVLALILAAQLAYALSRTLEVRRPVGGPVDEDATSVRTLGRVLFGDRDVRAPDQAEYVFAFEATSILIIVAMVGAVVLARRQDDR